MTSKITHFHLFCGIGGGALGFNRGEARVGPLTARFECLGGIDSDAPACRDFSAAVGVPATCLDLFSRDQYERFHGRVPPPSWREATIDDVRAAAGASPDILFTSPPCKGFSGLLSAERAASDKYQALNELVIRGLMLTLEAWEDDPPALILLENVPRIEQRGAALLAAIGGLLRGHGYAVRHAAHDAGEIGGLAQHRKRFLLVARHEKKVPAFLYEPARRRVRSIGEELAALPQPGTGSPMHSLPALSWATWLRLALIPAGKDWRALRGLDLGQYGLVENTGWRKGILGVQRLSLPATTVTSMAAPTRGAFSIADLLPRPGSALFNNVCRLIKWDEPSACVTGGGAPSAGGLSVADPRAESWANAGHYGVVPWSSSAGAVTAGAAHDNGRHNVADPRIAASSPVIVALDGTWHRPLTTLELAALQGFPVGLVLDGKSHSSWRERIGNAVPPPAAQAIAGVMGQVLLMARSGQTFALSSTPIWVRQVALALTVDGGVVET